MKTPELHYIAAGSYKIEMPEGTPFWIAFDAVGDEYALIDVKGEPRDHGGDPDRLFERFLVEWEIEHCRAMETRLGGGATACTFRDIWDRDHAAAQRWAEERLPG
jgi:hypothetical protein